MEQDLFKPSLKDDSYQQTKSYDIGKLFYVAFFGGLGPTLVLGVKNAKDLNLDNKPVNLMIGAAMLILTVKVIIVSFSSEGIWVLKDNTVRWSSKGANILLFGLYYQLMKQRFHQHFVTIGKVKPLLKDAIIWTLIAGTVETVILYAMGGLF